jgi:hypothetical protein
MRDPLCVRVNPFLFFLRITLHDLRITPLCLQLSFEPLFDTGDLFT